MGMKINLTGGLINSLRNPSGLDAIILEGHEAIIKQIVESSVYSREEKEFLISTYKQRCREYRNRKAVIEIAEAELNGGEGVDKAGVDEDWLSFFFRTAEMVSDEQMQSVLGRILAEEVSHPDSISRSLIQALSIISGK